MRDLLKLCFFIILPLFGFSQTVNTSHTHTHGSSCCINGELSEKERQTFAESFLEWKFQVERVTTRARALPVSYTVPVVFHLLESSPTITDAQVQNLMISLNNAYSRSNDFGGVQDFSNSERGVDTQIEFCLAETAPDGGVTSGITRTITDYAVFDQDLESSKLKTMIQWDPRHYVNIWVVSSIDSELNATFTGSTGWDRSRVGGFATLPGGVIDVNDYQDGAVVAGLGVGLVAHELGHYLGLLHTFSETGQCTNNDCTVDGDMVCDTPPDRTQETYINCGGQDENNSCNSDTLIIQSDGTRAPDLDDMYNNFMDYGNSACRDAFSAGQAERMHFHLSQYRTKLYSQSPSNNSVCSSPCNTNVLIESINKDVDYPEIDHAINFTSTTTGVTNYEWYVESLGGIESNYSIAMPTGYVPTTGTISTSPDLTHTFANEGKYRVYLKAWDSSSPSCFASSSTIVNVTCGVDARFFPDKRLIASKQSVNPKSEYLDSVFFKNRTYNGQSYNWTVEHTPFDPSDGPSLPVFNATSQDLTHTFLEPGTYNISLEAINGSCRNTSGPFELTVEDPTMNGAIWIQSVQCYNNDSLRAVVRVGNFGYDTVHVGTPISFYSGNPYLATSTYLSTFYTTRVVFGYDYAKDFTVIIPMDKENTDDLYAMFNDSGLVVPVSYPSNGEQDKISTTITLPNTGLSELNYRNNLSIERDIAFKTILSEQSVTRCANTTYDFDVSYLNNGDRIPSIFWDNSSNLSCSNCFDPTLQLGVNDVNQMIVLTSRYGCQDTSYVKITVPYDTVQVINADTVCQNDPSPTFTAVGDQLKWYTMSSGGTASTVTPIPDTQTIGTSSYWVSETTDGCEGYRAEIVSVVQGPPAISVVNPTPLCLADSVPQNYLENSINTLGTMLWYDNSNAGVGSEIVPLASTSSVGSFDHWIATEGVNGCISEREQLTYQIKETEIVLPELTATRCANTTYTFDANISDISDSIDDVSWLPNTNLSCSDCLNPTLQLGLDDVNQTIIIRSEYGCLDTAVVNITVPYDTVEVTYADSVCVNDPSPLLPVTGNDLLWYTAQVGGIGTSITPIAETSESGTFNYWVSETTNGCEGHRVGIASVVKPLPNISIIMPSDICRGSEIPINYLSDAVVGNGTLLWYADESTNVSEDAIANSSVVGSFNHWVSITGNNECVSNREQVTYIVKDIPDSPVVEGPLDVCIDEESPDLSNSILDGEAILWYEKETDTLGTSSIPILSTDSVKIINYWVTQTVNACEGPQSKLTYTIVDMEIELDSALEVDFGMSLELNTEVIIKPETALYTVEWLDEDFNVFSFDQSTIIDPLKSANYSIEVTSEFGCLVSDQVYVKVLGLLFPTHIFSPNDDGTNDYWYIENLEDLSDVKVMIYNQWGNIVYTSNDYQNDWDGVSNGQRLPVGTYYYVIDLSKYEREEKSGSITITY